MRAVRLARPPAQAIVAAMLALVCYWLAGVFGNRLLYLPMGFLLGLALISVAVRKVSLTVELPGLVRVAVGDTVEQRLVVRNQGRRTSPAARAHVTTPGLSQGNAWIPELAPGQSATAVLHRLGQTRLTSARTGVHFHITDPTGAQDVLAPLQVAQRTIVHPPYATPLSPGAPLPDEDGMITRAPGSELSGVRDHTPGDSVRAIHWRATARHGQLVVVERLAAGRPAAHVLILGDRLGDTAERALVIAARTASTAVTEGRPVRVRWVSPAGVQDFTGGTGTGLLDWVTGIGPVDPSALKGAAVSVEQVPVAVIADGAAPGTLLVIGDGLDQTWTERVAAAVDGVDPILGTRWRAAGGRDD